MPNLRILTWNSTGEDAAKALELDNECQAIAVAYPFQPDVDVFLIQEAQQAPGGAISAYLNGLAGYTVHHIQENLGGGGKGYICATRNAVVTVNNPIQLWDYAADPEFTLSAARNVITPGCWTPPARTPAYTVITVGGASILLFTWHAPLGASMLNIIVGAMKGGGLIDAYIAFENSQILNNPQNFLGFIPQFIIIAGDMNATSAALARNYYNYTPLDDFLGVSNHLDHIMAHSPPHTAFNVDQDRAASTSSTHDTLCARMHW